MTDRNLIFDVGMHTGEDTAYYLAKGFRVVAFEADPDLVASAKLRFARAIDENRLAVIPGAIVSADMATPEGTVRFFKKKGLSELGTVVPQWMDYNAVFSGDVETLSVPAVDFVETLRRIGSPYFLKIDIEGVDSVCLASLAQIASRPRYVSIEINRLHQAEPLGQIDLLASLGYQRFCIVDQRSIPGSSPPGQQREGQSIEWRFPTSSSGAFGLDLPGPWLDSAAAKRRISSLFRLYRLFGDQSRLRRLKIGRYNLGAVVVRQLERFIKRHLNSWHDLHAWRAE